MIRVVRKRSTKAKRQTRNSRCAGHADIAAALGSEILSGARKPGSRMPSVEEMFGIFGVSRVVVREVTKTLAAKGMVVSKTKVGTLVSDPANWNWLDPEVLSWRLKLGVDFAFLRQIAEIRDAVEPAAAALAARHRTRGDLARMRAALKAMRQAEGKRHEFTLADLTFHLAVAGATHNPLLQSFTAAIQTALRGLLAVISANDLAGQETHAQAVVRHAALVVAIEARDEKNANKAMARVIVQGTKHLEARRRTGLQ